MLGVRLCDTTDPTIEQVRDVDIERPGPWSVSFADLVPGEYEAVMVGRSYEREPPFPVGEPVRVIVTPESDPARTSIAF